MLEIGCISVYLKYYTLSHLVPLMVYPKVLFGVDIYRYIQCSASGKGATHNCIFVVPSPC